MLTKFPSNLFSLKRKKKTLKENTQSTGKDLAQECRDRSKYVEP